MENKYVTSARNAAGNYNLGSLPSMAPLALAYVPFQQNNPPTYEPAEALARGTLFPGLDLPFMNCVNESNPYAGTPLGELMALDFAIKELNLYLDTHSDDKDAFDMLKYLIELERKGRETYTRRYGPLTVKDLENAQRYSWIDDPWPWSFNERTGGK